MEPNLFQSAFSRGVHPIANERADLQNRNARDCKVPIAVLYLRVESESNLPRCPASARLGRHLHTLKIKARTR